MWIEPAIAAPAPPLAAGRGFGRETLGGALGLGRGLGPHTARRRRLLTHLRARGRHPFRNADRLLRDILKQCIGNPNTAGLLRDGHRLCDRGYSILLASAKPNHVAE